MQIVREEIFGPIATIIKFKTEEGRQLHFTLVSVHSVCPQFAEVLVMANDTSYGLACGVFTQNTSRAIRVTHALEAGMAFVCLRFIILMTQNLSIIL